MKHNRFRDTLPRHDNYRDLGPKFGEPVRHAPLPGRKDDSAKGVGGIILATIVGTALWALILLGVHWAGWL